MTKYVMVKFSDGDYRVYRKQTVSKRRLKEYEDSYLNPEVVAEGEDKDALIAMAQIAREAFIVNWPSELDLADRTEAGDFP